MVNITDYLDILEDIVKDLSVPIIDLMAAQSDDPFKILVGTILSARTKDETTSKAVDRLFSKIDGPASLRGLPLEEIETLIYPVGFYKNKARFLLHLPDALEVHGGKVPSDLDALTKLPGVGRKTANLVLSQAFEIPAICVDTHVHRIVNIWGYVQTDTPFKTEMALREKLPVEYWRKINSYLVAFGQGICKPVSPRCNDCPLNNSCPKIGVKQPASARKQKKKELKKRLISWNVNGIRALEKKGLIDIIQDSDADIFALQETKAHPSQLSEQLINIDGYTSYFASAKRKGYSGVAIYTKEKPIQVIEGIGEAIFDEEGRALTLEFADYYLVNAYFPNAQHELARIDYKIRFNQTILAFMEELKKKKTVILCGDLNVAHKEIDLRHPQANRENPGFSEPERLWMDRFIETGYVDTFRMFNSEPDNYTWWSYRMNARQNNVGWRIDYFCINQESADRVKNAAILSDIYGSDHCPVSLEIG